MRLKELAIIAVLLSSLGAAGMCVAQVSASSKASMPVGTNRQADAFPQSAPPAVEDMQPQHITVVNPTPAATAWSLPDKIAWAANLVLVIVAYAGVLLALSLLKKIDRQTAYAETAADAASSAAQAALLHAQAILNAERPWLLVTFEPSRSEENSFTVLATNRGRTPARIASSVERNLILVDENRLPKSPGYDDRDRNSQKNPAILLPGESTVLMQFNRGDAKGLCDSEERFRRIETWEEKVFLYGKVVYRDLIAPVEKQLHETNWCCWYIHGRQSSGLVAAGPAEYHAHT